MTFDEVAATLLSKRWIYAKTMPHCPHWYTLRKEWGEDEARFEAVAEFIRVHGYREKYGRSFYTRLDVNEFKYWTMGAPLGQTILINRAERDAIEPYDLIADKYDNLWSNVEAEAENIEAMRMLDWKPGESVLDVGCGSGLLLDYLAPDCYVGLDPSLGMLTRTRRRAGFSPDHQLVRSKFETFYTEQKFDLIVSLFGSPNYVEPHAWSRLSGMLNEGGRYVLMFYKAGYDVVTHLIMDVVPQDYFYEDYPPGTVTDFGNYVVVRS